MEKNYYTIEEWKAVKDYEGYYEVSTEGRVRSLDRYVKCNSGLRLRKGRILKFKTNKKGYLQVNLSKEGKKTFYRVSVLVATAFIPNPENKPCVDHINTIRTDNRVCNLRWVTYKENANNPLTKEKYKRMLNNIKPIIQYDVKTNRIIARYDSTADCSRSTGINIKTITSNLIGTSKVVSKQFYFRYA